MTTLSTLIEDALRMIGALPEAQPVTAYQSEVGLRFINDLIDAMPSRGVGSTLAQARVTGAYTISQPSILHVIATSALTIKLPTDPHDGFRVRIVDVGANFATNNVTIDRNGWLIDGSAADVTLSTNSQTKVYQFRSDLGDWRDITSPLAISAESPYPGEFDGAMSALLGVRLLAVFPRDVDPGVYALAEDGLTRLRARYMPDITASFDRDLVHTPSRINDRWTGGEI